MAFQSEIGGARASRNRTGPTKGEARREALFTAASRLFRENGYHATSMQDIANEVGLEKGSLYYHVSSKEDLLFQIMDWGASVSLSELEDICAKEVPATEKVQMAVRSLVGTLARLPEAASIFLQELRSLSPEHVKLIASKRKRYEALFLGILEEGISKGLFKLDNAKLASYGLLGMCNWLHIWYRKDGASSPAEVGSIFADIFLRGCLNTDGTDSGTKDKL